MNITKRTMAAARTCSLTRAGKDTRLFLPTSPGCRSSPAVMPMFAPYVIPIAASCASLRAHQQALGP